MAAVIYPDNDVTAEWQALAAVGGEYDATEDVIIHQAVAARALTAIHMNGHRVTMYGGPAGAPAVVIAGKPCTGPAQFFLDAAGNPIGPPHSQGYHTKAQWNPLQEYPPDGVLQVDGGIFDDNITALLDSTTGLSTDAWDGTPLMPSPHTSGSLWQNMEVQNFYGGVHYSPDGIHCEGSSKTIENFKMVTSVNAPNGAVAGGRPSGICGAASSTPTNKCVVRKVDAPETFLELDGLFLAGLFENVTMGDALISGNSGSQQGLLWKKINLNRPTSAGPVLQFNPGTWTDWTIEDSILVGNIGNPGNFQGTYNGKGNTPATWPTS